MIPHLVTIVGSPWDLLPPGVYPTTFSEVEARFSYNARRRALYAGLLDAAVHLAQVGCQTIILDGSYVSGKPLPGDYDACWHPDGIDFSKLDTVFGDFDNGRANQKTRFGGEFFPSTMIASDIGAAFVEFFQIDRFTGKRKGILSLAISTDETVTRRTRQ
jgi:hypothetical protein